MHGDLWSGNVLWGADGQAWLIDPGRTRRPPRVRPRDARAVRRARTSTRIIGGYQEVQPLAPGWQARIPLHQAWPLLVHAALFGGGYGDSALTALRRARG